VKHHDCKVIGFPVNSSLVYSPKKGWDMKRINQYDFYELGIALHQLRALKSGMALGEGLRPLLAAKSWLSKLLKSELIELGHSKYETEKLEKRVDSILSRHFYIEGTEDMDFDKDWGEEFSPFAFSGLEQDINRFENNFAAELREAATYYVPQIGMYNTTDLVDKAEIDIPEDIRPLVGKKALEEVNNSGRCLAFGLHTACGFHVLRAAECVLDDYYKAIVGEKYKELSSWNDYVVELEKRFDKDVKPLPSKRIIRSIRQIKDLDRNPLMHPRVSLNETDARITYHIAISAIGEMAKELRDLAGQGQLTLVKGASGGAVAE
jgi:hypothetical protein